MKNGETLYKKLKLGEVDKSQLTEQQKGDLYQYMVDSKKVTVNMIKPEVAQKYNLSVTPTPSRSPDTNAPIITPTYTPTHIPSRSPDTNAINYQPPKSTTPEMELVDILSNITMPTRGRTTQHERQQGSAYTPKPITQSTPTDLTLANRIEGGIKGIGYNWLGGILGASGTASEFLGTGEEITLGEGMKTEKGFDLSSQLQPSAKDLMKTSDELLYKGQQHTAKGREGLGTAGGVAYDILTGAGQMGADIGTAALTGVGMLPVLGTRVFGQGASEARQSGADINQQIAYGAISAGIEIATEKLVGGLPMAEKLGMGGVADNTIKKLANGIASSPRLVKALTYIANMAGEAAEEMIAEILNPIAKKLTYDQNADWATIEEVLYSGLLGAGISGVMGGGVLLQGNNQTPTETPTKTQSVMTNENIEPDIQGFQSTIDTGLNQLYSVLDSGQTDEQAIDTMVTNLEQVKKLMPTLSEYVDEHIERLNNYKATEQPQTNEIEEVKQTFEQDTSVPQIERNDVIDGTEQVVDDNKTIDNIIPIDELRQKEILQDSNKIVTETKQKKTFIDDDLTFKIPNKLNVDNPFLENTYHPFNMANERERQRERQDKWLNDKLQNMNTIKLSKPYEEERKQYAIITPSIKDGKYQITVFDNDDTPVMDSQRNTIEEVAEELGSQGFTYIEEIDVQATEQPTTKDTEGNELTTEQQETFKDSKVKDKDGNLLVVYHGTDAKFDKFEPNYAPGWGTGIYLTDNSENAKEYGENIIKAYVDIKKPFYDSDRKVDISNTKAYKDYIKKLADNENMSVEEYEDEYNVDWELVWDDLYNEDGDIEVISKALQELGYDGFIGEGSNNINGQEIVVFNPEQIQRVDNQNTTPQATKQPTTNETIPNEQIAEEEKYIIKKGDYVKIDGIGIGKAASDNSVEISGKRYYRDTENTDYSKSTAAEYWQDLQKQIKELKNIAKEKRKEAADYNKETGGMATKRKGKISMGDGRGVGFAENSVSAHHRKLLSEAKEFSDKANQLSKLVDERKAQLENRVRNNIPLYDYTEEAEALGVKITKQTPSTEDKSETKTDVAENETTETQDNKEPLNLNNYTFQYKDELTIDYDKVRKATVAGGLEAHAYSLPSSDTIRVVIEGESSVHPKTIYKKNILTVNGRPSNWQETTTETAKTENAQTEITIDNFMDSVNENDIDFKKAENAYRAVSFDPDKRAKSVQKDYVNTIKKVYDELVPLAKNDEQKTILLEEMNKFKENYIKKQYSVLDATSKTMSAMITGHAKFPTARNQKALETEHKRTVEFLEWLDKVVPVIKKKLNNALPETEKTNEVLNKLKKEVDDTIASLLAIKKGSPYNPAAFRSSLKGYFERNLNNGNIEEVRQASEYLKEQQKEKGITVFTSVNNIWKQIENAKSKKVITGENVVREYEGAKIVRNNDIDRIQIFFDEVPSQEIRNEMKKSGWHYSKANNNAWQRKITNNAEYNAKQIVEKYFKLVQPEMREEVKVDETTNKQTYRYYLTQRPPAPGAIPRGSKNTVSFDTKQEVDGLEAWGYVEYDKPLTEQQISDYELTENSETETVKNDTKVLGKTGIAKDNEGNAIEFVYEVVNANDLITSHDTNLNVNNNYPSELQPRERTRTASQMQVNDIVNNLQPEFLGENPKISDGSPIVGNDNIVESGNGRTIALAKMYQSKHKNAQKYKNWLITNAETFGIDTNNLPENPVLIRRRTTEVNRAEFVKKANESSIATMSATETARLDADKLTNEVLSLFVANENGIINTTDNKGFIGKFISEVIPKNEQNKYLTDKGELSQEGLSRVRNAIFYKAYGDINLMNKLAESLDNNAKNITNTMLAIAPNIVDIKTNIAKGDLYNIDYSSDIAQAANEFMALKETGKDVELYLQQESLFDNEDTALIKDIIAIFNANNRSVKKMTTILNKLFDSIENLGNPNQINMFGEMETPDKVHVLEATLRRLESEDNAQVTLFQSERKESTGDTQSNKGQTRAYKGGESYTRVNNSDLIDMSRPLKKPTDIRKDITKKFGVPTSSKKFNRSKKYLGYYKIMPEVIRLRYDNQIGTVMHELGHHLDKKYGFNSLNKQLINDMINKMNPAFKDNYQKRELPGESIAEFLRYYTTDPTTAEEFAGEFYNLFESTLDKTDLKNIQEIRSDVLRWVNAERTEKRQSTIVPLSQKKKVSERISETIKFEKANSVLFDRYAPIQEFVKTVEKLTGRKLPASLNPYMLVERTYKNNARIEGIIKGQFTDTEYNPLDTDDSLQKIVDDVKRDVTPFEDYLKLKHAITLAEKDHMIYNPDIYNNVEDMQRDLEFIEQQYPQFVKLSERLYDWYDKFFKAWVVDTNMLGEDSKKVYAKMRQEYPYYVPMFRVRENGSSKQASSSLTDQKTPVDRLSEKGSDKDTISPIDNIITQVSRMVNAYSKNNVMRAIVENYNTVDGLGGFIDRVPPDMEKQILSTQSIKDSLETDFEDVDNIDDIINSIPDLIENYKPLTKSRDKEIVGVITKSGKRQFYQVFDKAFLNSLTNMNPTQLDATVRMIASVRRTTTALTTGLNPIFGIASNAPRDFLQAYVFGSYKNPAEYVYQYAKALTGVVKKNDNYKTFRDIGGVYGSSMTTELRTKNDFIRRLTKYRKGQKVGAKNALSYIGELILDFNDAIETAPRLAEFNKAYKIAKKRGDSDYDATLYALSRADDVTLNFSRRGEIMNTAIGQSIPYFNAGLQGMDKLRRGLFTGEERTQTLIKSITMLTIPTILLWLAHRDDEDYEKLTKGIKDNYWILWKNPDGSFVRIPKPKDLSTIFSADFERALNAYFKEEGAGAFEGFYSTIADSLLPPVDTVFRPLIDVIGNEKWSGGKIVPMAMEYLPKTEQYDETTSRIAVELAQLIGKVAPDSNFASPKNVDYVLDQYYGGLADVLLPIATPTTYVDTDTLRDKYKYLAKPMTAIMQVGETINRKFKADPSYSNNIVNDFYDLRDKTMKANNAYEDRGVLSDDVDLIAGNQFKAYYKSISSMWKTIDYIDSLVNKTLPDGHKESYEKLINQSRFADSEKQKVINDMKDGKLNRESVTMLQKTVRDEIVKLADKAVKEYKANHKENNEILR